MTAGSWSSRASAADISADGRFVTFVSSATNLVTRDANGVDDVFLRDLALSRTHRNSIAADGAELRQPSGGGAVSDDGQRVAFDTHDPELGETRVFLRDRAATTTISVGVGRVGDLSADGSFVTSGTRFATELQRTNVRTGTTDVVTVTNDGSPADGVSFDPVITGDGRAVAFESEASNLVSGDTDGDQGDIFVRAF